MSQQICYPCTACLITVGDEILRGHIVDTNTSYLAKNLTAAGVRLQKVTVVPDVVRIISLSLLCKYTVKIINKYSGYYIQEYLFLLFINAKK